MNKVRIFLLLGVLLLNGCANRYVVTLSNGVQVKTSTKPVLKHGNWYFKDDQGRPSYAPAGRVREIAPESMSQDEAARFKEQTEKK